MAAMQLHKPCFRMMMERIEALALERCRAGEIAGAYLDAIRAGQILRQPSYRHLLRVLSSTDSTEWTQPGSLSEIYERGACSFVEKLAGETMASLMGRVIVRLPLFPYAPSCYRRSFRTSSLRANMRQFVPLLSSVFLPEDFDLVRWITMGKPKQRSQLDFPETIMEDTDFVIENLIALAIDEKDSSVCDAVQEGFLNKPRKPIQQVLLRGMLKSTDQKMHNLLLSQLLAEPHGRLGQDILHMAEYGRAEAQLMLMTGVLDSGLLQHESFQRMLRIWLGFGSCHTNHTILEKTARLALHCIQDSVAAEQPCLDHDPAGIQARLWSVSLFERSDVIPFLEDLLQRGSKLQKLAALSFAAQLDDKSVQTMLVFCCLSEDDLDIACLAMANFDMSYVTTLQTREGWQGVSRSIEVLQDNKMRGQYFQALCNLLPRIPAEGHLLSCPPFSGILSRESVYANLFLIAAWDFDRDKTEELMTLMLYGDAETRRRFIGVFLVQPQTEKERAFLFACLKDKSIAVRLLAANQISGMIDAIRVCDDGLNLLTVTERTSVMNLLALKSEEIRTVCISILLSQPNEAACSCAKELCSDKKTESKRLAGLTLLAELRTALIITEKEYNEIMAGAIRAIPLEQRSDKEKICIQDLLRTGYREDAPECGLGLFDPRYKPDLLPGLMESKTSAGEFFNLEMCRIIGLVTALCDEIEAHKDFTFTRVNYDFSEEQTSLGELAYMVLPKTTKRKEQGIYTLDDFVLPDVWRAWKGDNHLTVPETIGLGLAININMNNEEQRFSWVDDALMQVLPLGILRECIEKISDRSHGLLAMAIIEKMIYEFEAAEVFAVLKEVVLELVEKIPAPLWRKQVRLQKRVCLADVQEITYLLDLMEICAVEEELFQQYAACCIHLGQMADRVCIRLEIGQMARAADLGLIKPDLLYQKLCAEGLTEAMVFLDRQALGKNQTKEGYRGSVLLEQVINEIVQRIIEIELRSENITPVSHLALDITYHEGVKAFVEILAKLEKENHGCGAISQSINGSCRRFKMSGCRPESGVHLTKQEILLSLLLASTPGEKDKGQSLRYMIKQIEPAEDICRITEQTLLEAAMYAESWTAVVAEYLELPGFFSAVCFIRVHIMCWCTQAELPDYSDVNNMSQEDKALLAQLTPNKGKDINDGVFAADWLRDICKILGDEYFYRLLEAAEYHTHADDCTRLKLFADAALRRIPLETLYHNIAEKRCLDELISLGIVPLQNDMTADAMKRYEFIQEFFAQSQGFGEKRRVREKKACTIALKNLVAAARSSDVTFMC